jgi:outer membrane protein TolC
MINQKSFKHLVYIFCLFLSGCNMVGPDFIKPEAPVAEDWLETNDPIISTEKSDLSSWWTIFNDPVLDTLIDSAYKQNLSLQIAGIRILESRAQLGIAVGNSYPQSQ